MLCLANYFDASCISKADLLYCTLEPLNSTVFPGIPYSMQVNSDFASEQARYIAHPPLSSVLPTSTETCAAPHPRHSPSFQQTLSEHGASSITVVYHSLGAALSLLESVYLQVRGSAGGRLQDAPCWESGICQLSGQKPKRAGDAY